MSLNENSDINMEIQTLEIAGLAGVLEALRLPFGKKKRSQIIGPDLVAAEIGDTYCIKSKGDIRIHPDDRQLLKALVKRGDEHAKVMRGLVVWAKITAPVYWFCEEETYRAGHERLSSESTMHIDCKGLSGEELVAAKAAIPMGKELTKVDMFSYQSLRNIVRQRHDHRLPEWRQFCEWVRSLPLADDLIFYGLELQTEQR